jgi:energy-coupling factor transporter ATP-binding protein EcfA2
MAEPMLSVYNINVWYGAIHAIKDISFNVNEGEIVALLGKGVGNARAVRIAGVVEQGDLGVCVLLGQKLRGTRAHGGVGEADLEDRGLVLGDIERRGGRRDHEHVVGNLTRDGNGGTGGDGADERLHSPVAQGIEGVDGFLAVGDVVLGLKRELEVLGREILYGELGALLDRDAIGGRGTGQRTDDADLERLAVIGRPIVRATRGAAGKCDGAAERGGAGEEVPTAERAVDVEHGVPFSLAAVRPSCGTGQTLWPKR